MATCSVKFQADTLKVLASLRGRERFGHSYDKIVNELIRRHVHQVNQAMLAPDRLERIEALLVQILQKLDDGGDDRSEPPTFRVE